MLKLLYSSSFLILVTGFATDIAFGFAIAVASLSLSLLDVFFTLVIGFATEVDFDPAIATGLATEVAAELDIAPAPDVLSPVLALTPITGFDTEVASEVVEVETPVFWPTVTFGAFEIVGSLVIVGLTVLVFKFAADIVGLTMFVLDTWPLTPPL